MPKPKELVSSSASGSDSDSEVEKKLKRKKQVASEKPVKKQQTGEASRAPSSSKQSSSSGDDNVFQAGKMRGSNNRTQLCTESFLKIFKFGTQAHFAVGKSYEKRDAENANEHLKKTGVHG
ncbi:Activated RNA polymerase II transcriptional coactivator p15 [Myotis davidii]|uniref:Activated RNA polymerase II transcriptional coactivator p15 n=1 Tax=Myotis davidii TaxID=225400 RepID=L5M8L9_MYODS|nr:Activated RNA polymerase II transcriptional coactivator p15 [Myotis davidii]